MNPLEHLPAFNELPLHPNHPANSAWGLWLENSALGSLNWLTDEVVLSASKEIRTGQRIPVKYMAMDVFFPVANQADRACLVLLWTNLIPLF